MKYIRFPASEILMVDENEQPRRNADGTLHSVSFRHFVTKVLLRDAKAFGDGEGLEMRESIISAFESPDALRGEPVLAVENEAHRRLVMACNTPSAPFVPEVVGQLITYIRAIKNARDSF